MKRAMIPVFCSLLVLSLLLGTVGSAKAAPGDDPVVTPVSGDTDFTTEIVPIASLPGVVELEGGMLAPVGFPAGEGQFGGPGILVKGFDSGKATACFFLSAAEVGQGWGGKVALWDGSKWQRMETSITTVDETNTASACATITSGGTYAFIKYVTQPDLLPTALPMCSEQTFAMPFVQPVTGRWPFLHPGYLGLGFRGQYFYSDQLYNVGDAVTFEVLETNNAIFIPDEPVLANGTITFVFGPHDGVYGYGVAYDPFLFYFWGVLRPFTYKLTLPNCYVEDTVDFNLTPPTGYSLE